MKSGIFTRHNVFFWLCFLVLFSSCRKPDLPGKFSIYSVIKLVNDTLINPAMKMEKIIAGDNRLFMTYQHGDAGSYSMDDIQVFYAVSDNQGHLIKTGSIPVIPSYLHDFKVQDDGTFTIVTMDLSKKRSVLFYHFDRDGELIDKDSVRIPSGFQVETIKKSHKGVFVRYSDLNNSNLGMMECDYHGRILRYMPNNFWNYILTSDGNYLNVYSGLSEKFVYLTKFNNNLDTLWKKKISTRHLNSQVVVKLFPFEYHGQFLVLFEDYVGGYAINKVPERYAYALDGNGDIISSPAMDYVSSVSPASIFEMDDGNLFIINAHTSTYPVIFDSGINPNTWRILDKDWNLLREGVIQTQTLDRITAACKTSDGKIACFGSVQVAGRTYCKPGLILIKGL